MLISRQKGGAGEMSFTYDPTHSSDNEDRNTLRLLIGDINPKEYWFEDEELDKFLNIYSDLSLADIADRILSSMGTRKIKKKEIKKYPRQLWSEGIK